MKRGRTPWCTYSPGYGGLGGLIADVVAAGGDSSKVESKLAACNISKVVSNQGSYTALCSDGSAVSWGNIDCMSVT